MRSGAENCVERVVSEALVDGGSVLGLGEDGIEMRMCALSARGRRRRMWERMGEMCILF
jgi:hypothetical protein